MSNGFNLDLLGMDRRKSRRPISQSVKNDVWERARGKCEECGKSFSRPIWDWHHKDGNPTNNKVSNIMVVCKICHWDLTRKQHTKARNLKNKKSRQDQDGFGMSLPKPSFNLIGKPDPNFQLFPSQKKSKKRKAERDRSFF